MSLFDFPPIMHMSLLDSRCALHRKMRVPLYVAPVYRAKPGRGTKKARAQLKRTRKEKGQQNAFRQNAVSPNVGGVGWWGGRVRSLFCKPTVQSRGAHLCSNCSKENTENGKEKKRKGKNTPDGWCALFFVSTYSQLQKKERTKHQN